MQQQHIQTIIYKQSAFEQLYY